MIVFVVDSWKYRFAGMKKIWQYLIVLEVNHWRFYDYCSNLTCRCVDYLRLFQITFNFPHRVIYWLLLIRRTPLRLACILLILSPACIPIICTGIPYFTINTGLKKSCNFHNFLILFPFTVFFCRYSLYDFTNFV